MFRLFLMSFIIITAQLSAQNSTYPPPSKTHPNVIKLKNQLMEVVNRKDYIAFTEWLDPSVTSSFGGNGGIAEFGEYWNTEEDPSQLWRELERVLKLGGAYIQTEYEIPEEDRAIAFPYLFSYEPEDPDHFYEVGLITGTHVNVRTAPHLNSTVIDQFTYDVVWYIQEDGVENISGDNGFDEPEWYLVESYDRGTRGWVYWKYIRSPLDYRLVLAYNESGEWKIISFVAGD